MEAYDPIDQRRRLDGATGYKRCLARSFEEARDIGALTSIAGADLTVAVRCILVGYDEPARALLSRAGEWLSIAIRDDERPHDYTRGGTESWRHLYLAQCNWLLHGRHDAENYALYVRHHEEFLVLSKLDRNKMEIGMTLPDYVDARAYREALARFSHARMTPPASLARIRSEGQMSYVLCRHHLGEEYDPPDVQATLKRFLKYNVNTWLTNGHALRAAQWMKIAHWPGEDGVASAWDAVRACYDYLPVLEPAASRG